jgi:hypothetical protein
MVEKAPPLLSDVEIGIPLPQCAPSESTRRNAIRATPSHHTMSSRLYFLVSVTLLSVIADGLPTISYLDSSSNSSSTDICGPADWQTIILFYLGNYGAHAVTVVSLPGETPSQRIYWSILALLMPYSGIGKACQTISRGILGSASPLKRALHAGALCEVGEGIDTFWQVERKIHGRTFLWLRFNIVVNDIELEESDGAISDYKLGSSRGTFKSVFGILQIIYACATLYRSRGNQLEIYGYAAFGLTVTQYAVMSFVNLIANLITPEYSTLYMVRTRKMEMHEQRFGRKLEGVVVDLLPDRETDRPIQRSKASKLLSVVVAFLALVAPYCVIAGLTKFNSGNSTQAQKGWTMSWLVMSQVFGFGFGWFGADLNLEWRLYGWFSKLLVWAYVPMPWSWKRFQYALLVQAIPNLIIAAPVIGGFVVVGQMLAVHGNCSS